MRSFTFTILSLLLLVLSVNGQTGKVIPENPFGRYYGYFNPNFNDSLKLKLKGFTNLPESIKLDGNYHLNINPQNPYLLPKHYIQDEIAFDPGPSFDRMPNALVLEAGVHYTLKIVGQETPVIRRKMAPPPFKQP
jgi:hypothetical protein